MNNPHPNAGTPRHAPKIVQPSLAKSTGEADLASAFAERAYIASLIRDPDGRKLLADDMTVDHFARPACREAFTAITLLVSEGIWPDAATLATLADGTTMIEIETSLRENVSAANRGSYVSILKDYRRKRQLHEWRGKLMEATQAGRPAPELRKITEEMEALQQGEENKPAAKSRFVRLSAMGDRPPAVDWLIRGYLERDTVTQLFGDPGSGKSFLALDMALSIATGHEWRGHATKSGPVFYLAGEGLRGLQRRKEAWLRYHGVEDRSAPFWLSDGATALSDPGQLAALMADIDAASATTGLPPALIAIDTLARNFGSGDENSTKDMGAFIAALDTLRQRYRCGILPVHHSGHADKSRARGAMALLGGLDAEYRVEKIGDDTVRMVSTKQKDNDPPPALAWTLERYDLPWADEDGQPMNSAVLVPNDEVPAARPVQEKMGTQQRHALELLQELYRTHRTNLEDDDRDPNTARVSLKDWQNAMQDISEDRTRRSAIRSELLKGGHIRVENGFVFPCP